MPQRRIYYTGCFFGAIAVIILALAAHYLEGKLTTKQLQAVKTGAEIQLIHACLIILFASGTTKLNPVKLQRGLWILIAGISCFSFSIYLLSVRDLINLPVLKFLGPVTPLGGLLIISAWFIFISAFSSKSVTYEGNPKL